MAYTLLLKQQIHFYQSLPLSTLLENECSPLAFWSEQSEVLTSLCPGLNTHFSLVHLGFCICHSPSHSQSSQSIWCIRRCFAHAPIWFLKLQSKAPKGVQKCPKGFHFLIWLLTENNTYETSTKDQDGQNLCVSYGKHWDFETASVSMIERKRLSEMLFMQRGSPF